MAKVLVVYYSRSGYTRRIAAEIAGRCGADLEEIRDTVGRSKVWGYWRSIREALRKELPPIEASLQAPGRYDIVVIGTPVWVGGVASPVRSWVARHAADLGRVAVFCTQGAAHEQSALADLAKLCGREPIARLALADTDIDRNGYDERLRKFIAAVAGDQAPLALVRPAA